MRPPALPRPLRIALAYGLPGGLVVAALRAIEYRYLVLEHTASLYGGLVAALFAALGIWIGRRIATPRATAAAGAPPLVPVPPPAAPPRAIPDAERAATLGITRRELEILGLIAEGLSNRDIAERIFVSENTVKTHASRLFDKLDARRRTQAVQIGKRLGLIT